MNNARLTELMNYFDYNDKFTLEDFINIQVPSIYFPNKGTVAETLDEALKQGLIEYDKTSGLYSKPY